MNVTILGITWAEAENLWYIPLVIIGLFLLGWRFRRLNKAINVLVRPRHVARLLPNFSFFKTVVKHLLFAVALIFLFFALLRPQWDKKDEMVQQEGRDLFIALDISRSMLAKDLLPNRLEFAKAKIKTLLTMLESERIGLILFSGSTFVQCPLTIDFSAFHMYLNQIDVETISSGTTAIDQAIRQAIDVFNDIPGRKNKLLVLLTDGEDFSSNLSALKREAVDQGLNIFTVGIGTTEGAPVPLLDAEGNQKGHQLDKKGSVVISRLNEGILHSLAEESGGKYISISLDDDADLQLLVRSVERFEKEKFEDKKFSLLEEQYPYFLLVSFICFALEWIL